MQEIKRIIEQLEPAEALEILTPQLKKILSHLDEEARMSFVTNLMDGAEGDKVSSMVNL